MGAQASKQAARRLPKQANPETLAQLKESPATMKAVEDFVPDASDGPDPLLDKNLAAIGQVKIEPTKIKMRSSDSMLHIIRARQQVEQEEEHNTANKISIDAIFSILERRKHMPPGALDAPSTLSQLAKDYKIDEASIATLYKYYNTPAILPGSKDAKDDRRKGIWVNDNEEWKQAVRAAAQHADNAAQKATPKQPKPTETPASDAKDTSTNPTGKEKRLQELFED